MSIKKTTKFIFPVGDEELNQDTYYRTLSEANNGFYPFGENGLWHGGIHLDEKVLNKLGNDEQLHCMANGEVIAYRINDVYPKITYPDENVPTALRGSLKNVAYFSTGFTLVRHLLQMPKTTDAEAEQPAITLYSLYMHQLDWYGYQEKMKDEKTNVQYPHYWQLGSGKADENKTDTVFGSVIRANGSGTEVVGLLLKGSKICLSEKHATKAGWFKIVSISEGTLVTSTEFKQQLDTITGYVWHSDVSPEPTGKKADTNQNYEVVKEDNNTVDSPEVNVKGIAVYETADDKQKLTYLPLTATFELDGQENGYAKISKINDCDVPNLLVKENGSTDAPHKGYVKVTSLTSLTFKPEKFNDIVVLKSPIAISSGDFIGYIGHNQQQTDHFNEPAQASISTIKRPSDTKLPPLLHVELFTCEDLSAFITKTRALADNLPESEKKLILIAKGARLIQASKTDGNLTSGLGIKFTSDKDSYYVKINLEYTLNSKEYYADNNLAAQSKVDKKIEENDNDLSNKTLEITLTADNKEQLENRYNKTYPQLTKSDIPDKVELVEVDHNSSSVKIRFCVNTKHYWIASKDVSHLFGQDGTLNTVIPYWNNFPLSFDNLPPATKDNTVHFPRTVSLDSLSNENLITIEDESTDSIWVKVTAGNEERWSITGWVNIKKDAQEHVKRISPWHWQGFETVIEKASVGEFYTKINDNRAGTLDIKEYTDSMKAMHKILIESLLYSVQRKKGLPPFTVEFLKDGLRNSWIAEMIGHLIIKYESEWYADEALTKWNEIDNLFEKQTQKQKKLIEKWLDDNNITMPFKRNSALNSVDEAHEETKIHWQLEKEQRIKPSLWWQEVAQNQQQAQPTNDQTPALSNLSADGKAWFIHPVSIMGRFISPGIVTYHIYHDGKIEKHIPLEISKGYEQKYKYVYHDEKNNEHEICICDWHTTKEKANGVVISAPNRKDPNIIEYKENLKEGDTQKRVKFKNGDIAEYGKHSDLGMIWRRYKALNKNIEIVRMPDKINYTKDDVIISYVFSNTKRRYTGPDPLAGFIGALAETGLQLTTTGSCFAEGSCFPSSEHVNGKSIDTLYLNDNDEQKFINAMHKFNFNEQITGNNKKKFDNAKQDLKKDLHNTHLHSEFKPGSIKEIIL
ncbi:hypothetical protein H3S75_06010 [Gilliamella sp. B14384G15]|uniref:hypothetical protein n=1 Tax=unclassified Gilliamella TaxID=2685620 RepID=UPI0018DE0D73|nr:MULTISPECIES: hypothetical protein [unclassified Gilliamella]MBI0030783.1 hypothetical protein [Gilliamella sp. B14384G15]MBI0058124.1 hypothetical protein [Gilliamella sp. B14384G12]